MKIGTAYKASIDSVTSFSGVYVYVRRPITLENTLDADWGILLPSTQEIPLDQGPILYILTIHSHCIPLGATYDWL